MKHRQGFVSNSSSASFIVHWRMRTFGKEATAEQAVGKMLEVSFKENETEIDWENTWNKKIKEMVEDIIRATNKNDDGTFTSVFHTSMMNSTEDFGESAKSLVMGLVAKGGYQIIDAKVDSYEM